MVRFVSKRFVGGRGRIEKTVVGCPSNDYRLEVIGRVDGKGFDVFGGDPFTVHFALDYAGRDVFITGRDLERYPESVQSHEVAAWAQYLEVGAGLGGFVPWVIDSLDGLCNLRPIVIDPANYSLMKEMAQYALGLSYDPVIEDKVLERLRTYEKRCGVILDEDKVWLVNDRVSDAVKSNPSLMGCADFLVSYGARNFQFTESVQFGHLENNLLNPRGVVLSF